MNLERDRTVNGYLVQLEPGARGYIAREDSSAERCYVAVIAVHPENLCEV